VCKPHGIPIIGQGGITTASDAIEFLIAGAATVGIGTALFYDPLICTKINHGIIAYLQRHGIPGVNQLCGSLSLNSTVKTPCTGG
jgi:dihydroorotate dehydrogenase (NAD+) catalytic subunit